MADWVAKHRESISFVVLIVLGTILVLGGAFVVERPSVMAFGASLFGIPHLSDAVKESKR